MRVASGGARAQARTPRATGVLALASAISGSAGFSPAAAGAEGFVISSPEGQNSLRVGLDAIYKLEPRSLNGDWQDRDAIYAARPFLSGTVFRDWIRFLTEAELAQNPPYLLYSYLEVRPRAEFGFRIGQQNS